MAKIIDLPNQLKVSKENGTVNYYDKLDSDGNTRLSVKVENGNLLIDELGLNIETFDYASVKEPTSVDMEDLADQVNTFVFASIPDIAGEMYFVNGTTDTVIASVGVPVKVDGVYVDGILGGFSHNLGTLTYNVATSHVFKISVGISAVPVSGTNIDYSFAVFVNGVAAPNIAASRRFSNSSDTGRMALGGLVELFNGDEIELRVQNDNGTQDVLISSLNLNIK